jgi:hypothetical protein
MWRLQQQARQVEAAVEASEAGAAIDS